MKKKIFKYLSVGLISFSMMSVATTVEAKPESRAFVDTVLKSYIHRCFDSSLGTITHDDIDKNYTTIYFNNSYDRTVKVESVPKTMTEILVLKCFSKEKYTYTYRTW